MIRFSYRLVVAFLLFSLVPCSAAFACSVCRCGDPTFNALGTNIFVAHQFHLAFDSERLEKEQGAGDEIESLTETRFVLTGSYGISERLQVVARIPWSRRSLASDEEPGTASGLGDPELYGIYRLWSSDWEEGMGKRSWVSVVAGVKTAWGKNDAADAGERLDEHVQPGTGSTDLFAGLSAVHLFDDRSTIYGSIQLRKPSRNGFDYLYGDTTLVNLGYEHKLSERWDGALEVNARAAGHDQIDATGEEDPDTGGAIVYLSPRLLFDLGRNVVARIAVQVPAVEDLHGDQREKTVWNLGVTATF
ncbi:MAG: hypothetical protein ABI639_08795 [Thermoanaerobaculia bacterium]